MTQFTSLLSYNSIFDLFVNMCIVGLWTLMAIFLNNTFKGFFTIFQAHKKRYSFIFIFSER